jgi:hypothetical protein
VTFTMAGSGHIAGVINHPDANKYQHWTNEHLPGSVEGWRAGAVEHPGSWWPHWATWLKAKSGKQVPARDPAKGVLKPIEDAPGSYRAGAVERGGVNRSLSLSSRTSVQRADPGPTRELSASGGPGSSPGFRRATSRMTAES